MSSSQYGFREGKKTNRLGSFDVYAELLHSLFVGEGERKGKKKHALLPPLVASFFEDGLRQKPARGKQKLFLGRKQSITRFYAEKVQCMFDPF